MPRSNKNSHKRITQRDGSTFSAGSRATAKLAAKTRSPLNPVQKFSHQQRLVLSAFSKKGRPQLGLPAVYGQWGSAQINKNRRLNKKEYRMHQIQHRVGFGGTGLDEMVSTETVNTITDRMNKAGRSREDIKQVTYSLSKEREQVRYLLWTTNDPERPLSGHPGALSKRQNDMRFGLTGSHGDKNNIRAKWVLNQYQSGMGTETERLTDTRIMANIMTNQLFSEPFAQLNSISPTLTAKPAYHPVHGSIYRVRKKSIVKTNGFRKAALNAHNARERRKWDTAEKLMKRGYTNLVHPDMRQWIDVGKDWENGLSLYMQHVGGEQHTDTGAGTSTAYIPKKTDGQLTMSQWNTNVRLGTMQPAIGKPRPLMSRASLVSSVKPRPYKQQLLTAYFKHTH